jgi:hypothetical protein
VRRITIGSLKIWANVGLWFTVIAEQLHTLSQISQPIQSMMDIFRLKAVPSLFLTIVSALVGQTRAHVSHAMQTLETLFKGGVTYS